MWSAKIWTPLAMGAALLVGVQVYPVPTPAPSTMPVSGSVSINNTPSVSARQEGSWMVSIAGQPAFNATAPSFLEAGRSYAFKWEAGATPQTYKVVAVREDGWVRVEGGVEVGPGVIRWINPARALIIDTVR